MSDQRTPSYFVYSRKEKKLYAVGVENNVIGERFWDENFHRDLGDKLSLPYYILEDLEKEHAANV